MSCMQVSATPAPYPDPLVPVMQVKLDVLYKPILRRFRDHLRTRFDRNHNTRSY